LILLAFAAAGVGAAVGNFVGGRTGSAGLAITAAGIANAATRSAITGDSFGASLKAAIPDIVAQLFSSALISEFSPDAGEQVRNNPSEQSTATTGAMAEMDMILVTANPAGLDLACKVRSMALAAEPIANFSRGAKGLQDGDPDSVYSRSRAAAHQALGATGAIDPNRLYGPTIIEGAGSIESREAGFDPYFFAYRDDGANPSFGAWLSKNYVRSSPDAYANDLINHSQIWHLEKFVLRCSTRLPIRIAVWIASARSCKTELIM
jgi:hypothetical protein